MHSIIQLLIPPCDSHISSVFLPAYPTQVYSQTTWEEVFGPSAGGRAAVAEHIAETVGVYVEASADDKSHFARIAACYAMAELVAKVDHETVRPSVDRLLAAVVQCLTVSPHHMPGSPSLSKGRSALASHSLHSVTNSLCKLSNSHGRMTPPFGHATPLPA